MSQPLFLRDARWMAIATLLFVLTASGTSLRAESAGKQLFAEHCAHCHGDDGQGGDGYERPLFGEESIADLTRIIATTMPEDDPDACTGEDAQRVAEFLHGTFYSTAARIRRGLIPQPRIELSRLTVPQHRNALADVVGSITPPVKRGDAEPGLRAEYFQSKGMSKANDLKLTRVDAAVDLDFGEGAPQDDIAADQFAIIWQGSVATDDTGHHEFRVSTPNGVRLYVNHDEPESRRKLRDDSSVAGQAALIDQWVSSGKQQSHTARLFLLGGRHYPLRLEFFKYKEKRASVKLEWKPPHGVWQVLDARHLSTQKSPRTFVTDTAFPADDRSLGYERGSAISAEWHESTTAAAVATANEIVSRLPVLLGKKDNDPRALELLATTVMRRAYRRPLRESEENYVRDVFEQTEQPDAAVRRVILFTLSSPYFLYTDVHPEAVPQDSFAAAARLAWSLWDSLPDAALWTAARNGRLQSAAEVHDQALRMLADPRAQAKLWGFFQHWLELDERDLEKDRELFPGFDEQVVADLRYSLRQFVLQTSSTESSDYRQLLSSDVLYLNERLSQLYGFAAPEGVHGEQFVAVAAPPGQRAGVLTHPYLLSALSYHNSTSPIHRGVFVTRNLMGRSLKPPPVAVAFENEVFDANLSMREKITQLTRDRACMSCHSVVNPLGFALESYDAVGRWRERENGRPVNTESEYITRDGKPLTLDGAADIARFAVANPETHLAFVRQMFMHFVKQNPAAYPGLSLDALRDQFAQDRFHIQRLTARLSAFAAIGEIPSSHREPEKEQ